MTEQSNVTVDRPYLLLISAESPEDLGRQVSSLARSLAYDAGAETAADVCYTASLRQPHHPYRVAVVGSTAEELAERLSSLSEKSLGGPPAGEDGPERLAVMLTGQGSQWLGMGRDLLAKEPVFRSTVEECDALMAGLSGWSVIEELNAGEEASRLTHTDVAQPAIFAVQVGLLALYDSWGVRPDAVVGHSSGEAAAAYCSGALSLEDAAAVIYHRSRLMQQATGNGRMAAVGLAESEARELVAGYDGRLEIATSNAPKLTVVAGEPEALGEALAGLKANGVFCKDLGVDYAFHTSQMEPFLDDLRRSIAGITPRPAQIGFVSTVTGETLGGSELGPGYWTRNMRRQVRFTDAANHLIDGGFRVFLEVGPHPALSTPVTQCLKERGVTGTVVPSLRSGKDGQSSLLSALGGLFVAGCEVDFAGLYPQGGRPVKL